VDEFRLLSLLSDQQPRRKRVVENILKGRRTVSTLFWGMRYGILDWLGYEKKLQRDTYDSVFDQLIQEQLVEAVDQQFRLTEFGTARLNQLAKTHYQPQNLAVGQFYDSQLFQERLLLIIQVVSEYSFDNRQYYPQLASQANLQFAREWFRWFKINGTVDLFAKEIQDLLQNLNDDRLASLVAFRFMGHGTMGLTTQQLAVEYNSDVDQIAAIQTDVMLGFIPRIKENPESLLSPLIAGIDSSRVSASATQTLAEVWQHHSFKQISQQRRLKESTVKEHILEAAILLPIDKIPYDALISQSLRKQLASILSGQEIDEWQFDQLTAKLPDLDFFYFRLYQILRSKEHVK